jgi:CelD/BcsL family acetyltransferase involved in cellulose biosynthesis
VWPRNVRRGVTTRKLTIEPLGGVDDARADWTRLAEECGNPFATVEWCEAWLTTAGAEHEPRLFAARAGGEIVAVLPLVITHGRYVRKLRFVGFGAANELGPVSAPADRDAAARALRDVAGATRRDWDVFLADQLPGTGWDELLGARAVGAEKSPVARGPWRAWDDYLATRSRKFRQELRRKERRLFEQGARYRTVEGEAEVGAALDLLFDLHRARWGTEASPFFAGAEPFHRAFARIAFERGWLRLRILELDGEPAAIYHGFRFGTAEWSYQFGRAPGHEHESTGIAIAAHAIREAFAEGAEEFKLGPGGQLYKLRFATGDSGIETVAQTRGFRGRVWAIGQKRRR